MIDVNRIILIGTVYTTPFKAIINGKEKWFMKLRTIQTIPKNEGGYWTFYDVHRIYLVSKWMVDKTKDLKKGERLEIYGRLSILQKESTFRKDGVLKTVRFNDTTVIPDMINPRNFDVKDKEPFEDYFKTLSTEEKVEFKIPKK
jgi:hypothetical protein